MSITFRLLTEEDVRSVLTLDDLIETMASALGRFSKGAVEQPVRSVISVDGDAAFFATMPACVRGDSIRIAPHRSNDLGDVDRLFKVLRAHA